MLNLLSEWLDRVTIANYKPKCTTYSTSVFCLPVLKKHYYKHDPLCCKKLFYICRAENTKLEAECSTVDSHGS